MKPLCDHTSVGVIVIDDRGRHLLLLRAKPPVGRAPIAGHIDEHGGPNAAAVAEAFEEAGLTGIADRLKVVDRGDVGNICRREPSHETHDGHYWTIFEVRVSGQQALEFSRDETRGGGWYSTAKLQELAHRTAQYALGHLTEDAWKADPGLEPVWVFWLSRRGHITTPNEVEMAAIEKLWMTAPAS